MLHYSWVSTSIRFTQIFFFFYLTQSFFKIITFPFLVTSFNRRIILKLKKIYMYMILIQRLNISNLTLNKNFKKKWEKDIKISHIKSKKHKQWIQKKKKQQATVLFIINKN